jgi:Kef-type K+ transport system membrane component KefB
MSPFALSMLFFLQLAVILGVCRLAGALFKRLGQSQVVSEMVAGMLLGPSLLGWLTPEISAYLFPAQSKAIIFTVSQVGLVLYMFLIGVEFDVGLIRRRLGTAVSVSIAGIAVPFVLGGSIALLIARDRQLFSAHASVLQIVLFTGACMSITAFPMLARIISEQGLSKTSLGTLALAAGSVDDAAAWCVLAIILAAFQSDAMIAVYAIAGGATFVVVVLSVVKPLLLPLGRKVEQAGRMGPDVLVFVLMLLMVSAWFTDRIGIYSVFGAFIIGVAMPRERFASELKRMIQPLTTTLLLPVFFVYSGLNTKLGLVSTPYLWLLALVILAASTLGKGGACYLAARLHGETHRQALAVGALMNARGLMELIILNIGLERGLIQPAMFAIMVMMAIVTTLAATPIFERAHGSRESRVKDDEDSAVAEVVG